MAKAISKELMAQKAFLGNDQIDTIYFGGGTPSILQATQIEQLLSAVDTNYHISYDPEITLEANPDDLSFEKLFALKDLGINRLSIGIQSFQDKILSFLNRAHNSSEAIKSFHLARELGFGNISVDLIFSIPGQSMTDLEDDISRVLELNPEHISLYSLTIEEKTVFGNWSRKGKFKPIGEEDSARQFDLIIRRLEESNFEQYEISNFCRDNNYSRHNTSYWKNIPYLGVGPGAHSFDGKHRQFNIASNHRYMKSLHEGKIPYELDMLDERSSANEYLLTALRTKWGCDISKLNDDFNYPLLIIQKEKVDQLIAQNLIHINDNRLYLTRNGIFLADEIISDLFWI